MARKIFAGILIALSAILLVLSLLGIGAIWFYNEPLTRETTTRLRDIDRELALAEATLISSEKELERALRIVDNAQTALETLAQTTEGAENLFETIQNTLDDRLLPELKQARTRIETARASLENVRAVLDSLSALIPAVEAVLPSRVVADLIDSARSLDTEIEHVEALTTQA
jgi:chromosome segregation ATPase